MEPDWEDLKAPTDMPSAVPSTEWSRRFVAKEPTDGLGFYRRLTTKSFEQGDNREFLAIAGASDVDTENELVSVEGTDLAFYKTNPIGLPNHDMSQLPIFLTMKISKRKGVLKFTPRFAPKDVNPLAEAIFQNHLWRLQQKALDDSGAMFSVRGMPKPVADAVTFDEDRGGLNFNKQTLLEISDVTIGAQPRAQLLKAQAAGIDMQPVLEWALGTVQDLARTLETAEADQLVKALDPLKGVVLVEIKQSEPEPAAESSDPRLEALEKRLTVLEVSAVEDPEEPEEPEPKKSLAMTPEEIEEAAEGMVGQVLKSIDADLVVALGCGV